MDSWQTAGTRAVTLTQSRSHAFTVPVTNTDGRWENGTALPPEGALLPRPGAAVDCGGRVLRKRPARAGVRVNALNLDRLQ